MTTFRKRLLAALSAGSMFLSLATPAMATTTITISENGVGSDNDAEVELSNDTTLVQNNAANVENKITSKSSTGDNSASYNTGGAVLISSGDAKSDVKVENLLNSNEAFVDCCDQGDLDIEISKNGVDSDNKVEVGDDRHHREESGIAIYQTNYADVENDVESEAETGDNDAKYNPGADVLIGTGDATVDVAVDNMVNFNWADADCGFIEDLTP